MRSSSRALLLGVAALAIACGGQPRFRGSGCGGGVVIEETLGDAAACPAEVDPHRLGERVAEAAERDDEDAFVCQLSMARRRGWAERRAWTRPGPWHLWRRGLLRVVPALRSGTCRVERSPRTALVCGDRDVYFTVVEERGGWRIDET